MSAHMCALHVYWPQPFVHDPGTNVGMESKQQRPRFSNNGGELNGLIADYFNNPNKVSYTEELRGKVDPIQLKVLCGLSLGGLSQIRF